MDKISVIKLNCSPNTLFCRFFLQGSWSECPIWAMCSRTLLPLWGCVPNTWGWSDWGPMPSGSLLSCRFLISTALSTWPLQQQQQEHRALCLSVLPCWWEHRSAQDVEQTKLQWSDLWHFYRPCLTLLDIFSLVGFACSSRGLPAPSHVCHAGYYCPQGQNSSQPAQYLCSPGHMCPPGSATQISCDPGSYQSLYTQVSKENCVIATVGILKFPLLKLTWSSLMVVCNQYWWYKWHNTVIINYVIPYKDIWGCSLGVLSTIDFWKIFICSNFHEIYILQLLGPIILLRTVMIYLVELIQW